MTLKEYRLIRIAAQIVQVLILVFLIITVARAVPSSVIEPVDVKAALVMTKEELATLQRQMEESYGGSLRVMLIDPYCEKETEKAMRAMEPYLATGLNDGGISRSLTERDAHWKKGQDALKLWETVKRECWKETP